MLGKAHSDQTGVIRGRKNASKKSHENSTKTAAFSHASRATQRTSHSARHFLGAEDRGPPHREAQGLPHFQTIRMGKTNAGEKKLWVCDQPARKPTSGHRCRPQATSGAHCISLNILREFAYAVRVRGKRKGDAAGEADAIMALVRAGGAVRGRAACSAERPASHACAPSTSAVMAACGGDGAKRVDAGDGMAKQEKMNKGESNKDADVQRARNIRQ